MKLINPYVELIEQPNLSSEKSIYQHIERCGRTCYKSEGNITEDSAKPFVDRMIASKHFAMLEHGTVYLKLPVVSHTTESGVVYDDAIEMFRKHPFSICILTTDYAYVTTNLRFIAEESLEYVLQYLCEPTEYHQKRYTMRFVCSRACATQIIRHRAFSFAMESQRFINYSKEKFGSEITFICPRNIDYDKALQYGQFHTKDRIKTPESVFVCNLNNAEQDYIYLIKEGWKPQEARQVLPNATKTELIVTGFAISWEKFFDERMKGTTGKPDDEIQYLATQAHDLLKEEFFK